MLEDNKKRQITYQADAACIQMKGVQPFDDGGACADDVMATESWCTVHSARQSLLSNVAHLVSRPLSQGLSVILHTDAWPVWSRYHLAVSIIF